MSDDMPPEFLLELMSSLSATAFKVEMERIARVMDFIARTVKAWGFSYPVFA